MQSIARGKGREKNNIPACVLREPTPFVDAAVNVEMIIEKNGGCNENGSENENHFIVRCEIFSEIKKDGLHCGFQKF